MSSNSGYALSIGLLDIDTVRISTLTRYDLSIIIYTNIPIFSRSGISSNIGGRVGCAHAVNRLSGLMSISEAVCEWFVTSAGGTLIKGPKNSL